MLFLQIIIDVAVLIALFGLTIFVHELGHFLAAVWSGMVVDVFSIGFGPAIWKRKVRGVTLKIAWIPFGGYVSIPQLDPAAMSSVQGGEGGTDARKLPAVSCWKKVLVSLAGVTGNVILAFILAWIVYLHPSVITEEGNTVIGGVNVESEAYSAGIRPGDEIVSVNGERVRTWTEYTVLCVLAGGKDHEVTLEVGTDGTYREVRLPTSESQMGLETVAGIEKAELCAVGSVFEDSPAEAGGMKPRDIVRFVDGERVRSRSHLIELVEERKDKSVQVIVEREGRPVELLITPEFNEEHNRSMIGIAFADVQAMPWMQYKRPLAQVANDATQVFRMLKALVTPKEARQAARGLGGPPMILVTLWFSIRISMVNAIGFIRFLNVNLAVLNMLPIPVLDGGHLVFALWEGLTRRKVHPKLVNALINIFFVLLLGVMVLMSLRDFARMPGMFRPKAEKPAEAGGEPGAGALTPAEGSAGGEDAK